MDFHPLVVHFPIAFLTTYAVFELARFRKVLELPHWQSIKFALLVLGVISAMVTLIAALASDSLALESRLNGMYKLFMGLTALVFGITALMYKKLAENKFALVILALVGLFLIVVAGGLFGATVYGTHYDPYLAPIFKLLKVY